MKRDSKVKGVSVGTDMDSALARARKNMTTDAPLAVFTVMKKSFPDVAMRLHAERPWEQVPNGYVVSDYTLPVLHEAASEVALVWKGTNARKALDKAAEVLTVVGLQVRLQPKPVTGLMKTRFLTLYVSFPEEVV